MGLTDYTNNKNNDPNNGAGNPGGTPLPPGAIPPGGWFIGMPTAPQGPVSTKDDTDVMSMFINYNEKFKFKDKVLFRDSIIEQLLAILIAKDKPNGLLIGSAGVGKTAIVETIATMLANDDPLIPDQLKGFTVWELPLSNVVAGANLVGQLEENVKAVVAAMEDANEKAILFIDEIHQIISGNQTYDKIAQILKPALARGTMHVIGATTLQEAGNLMDDPAFNRRFSRVIVDELSRSQTIEILKNAKKTFTLHYGNIVLNDDILNTVAVTADQYKPAGSHRPDNALTLLDRSIGEAVVNRNVQIQTLQNKIKDDPNDTVSQSMLQAIQAVPVIPITDGQVKKTAISLATGNAKRDVVDMDQVKASFGYIKGQDEAKEEAIRVINRTENNLFPRERPVTLMFIGPSGVGKTEIAKIMAKELTGNKPIILNMTEYSDAATINRLIGSPAGYIGSDSHAELPFDELESNPYAVILLDEFEKACRPVQTLFFSVFEEGTLVDNHGKTIDFSKSIIIATTNAGFQELKHNMGFGSQSMKDKASIQELSKFFDPALINRFESLVNFKKISKETYAEILQDTYEREAGRILSEKPNLKIPASLPDDELESVVEESYNEAFGARPAFRAVKKYIENQVFGTP